MRAALLLCLLAASACRGGSSTDMALSKTDGGDGGAPADMSAEDPIVGRPCGTGVGSCPCGYFCPMGRCEVAELHPPCAPDLAPTPDLRPAD